jgi:hypothetical protein
MNGEHQSETTAPLKNGGGGARTKLWWKEARGKP